MRARVLLPDDLAALADQRKAELAREFEPQTAYEGLLVGEIALASARLERCAALAIGDLRRGIERAETCWDDDRRQRVEDRAARLTRDPARVAKALARSRQGADWLIERWEGLGEVLKNLGTWDDAQRRLAFDLLGVPVELRPGSTRVPDESDAAGLAALVADELARLRADRATRLDALDAFEQAMAVEGMSLEEDAASARLRRHESSCRRALQWAIAELRRVRDERPQAAEASRPEPKPGPELGPSPTSQAASEYLVSRTEAALEARLDAAIALRDAEIAQAAVAEPEPQPQPAARPVVPIVIGPPSGTSLLPRAATTGNRRARLAQQKRQRQHARRMTQAH
jgi:hypothetical protein